jgi:polysaccharide biosynthesis/export protein
MGMFQRARSSGMNRLAVGAMAAASLLVAGCASRGGVVPYDPANFGAPDIESLQLQPSAQIIGPLDKLAVSVFQVPDLTGEFSVDGRGQILYPLLGKVQAAGKTPGDLAQDIAARLREGYLNNPSVQVTIKEAVAQTITVEGSVRQPGVIPINGTTSLIQAIALGRGTSEDANPARVVVFRTIDGQRMAAAFDLRAIRRAEAPDPVIYGNDIIVVDGDRGRLLFKDIVSVLPVIGIFRPF